MTRALITGAGGFVGQHLIAELQASTDWELWALGRSPHATLPSVTADLLDAGAVRSAIAAARPDIVVHLAAQSFVPASFADPEGTLKTNVLGQLHLLQALQAQGGDPLVLVISSNEVYGMVEPGDIPVDERTPLRPANPYAVSKAAQDLLAGQWALSNGMRIIRVRPFNHIGPGQRADFVAPAFARQIARIERGLQPPVVRVGNLDAERDWTDVRDMVRAYRLALLHGAPGAVYNIGSGVAVPVRRLLDLLIEASSASITVELDPERMRPSDVPTIACDPSAFRAATGWTPAYSLDETMAAILDDWRVQVAHETKNHSGA